MKKITTFLTFLFFTLLVSCGAQSNNGVTSNVTDLDTSQVITTTTTSTTSTGTSVCGNIYSYTYDYFNILFKFYTTSGTYDIVAGDTTTQSLLNQMPVNVFANNVCATTVISGTTATLTNISQ